MLARAHTFTIDGLHTRHVHRRGGRARGAAGVRDRRPRRRGGARGARARSERRSATRASSSRRRRITANLAPGDLRKAGPGPRPRARVRPARGQRPAPAASGSSTWRCSASSASTAPCAPSHGTLAVAPGRAAMRASARSRSPARARARGARSSTACEVAAVEHLRARVRGCSAAAPTRLPAAARDGTGRARRRPMTGRSARSWRRCAASAHAVRALVIAAAGAHNLPAERRRRAPARRCSRSALPAILPPLSASEAIEVTRIREPRGTRAAKALAGGRPFRAPAPLDHGCGPARRRVPRLGRRGGARPLRRAVPGRAVGVRAPDAGGAAPAAGGRPRGDRAGAPLGGAPGAVHAGGRDEPVPVRLRGRSRALLVQRDASWRATAAG